MSIKQKMKQFFVKLTEEHFSPNIIEAERPRSQTLRILEIRLQSFDADSRSWLEHFRIHLRRFVIIAC